MLEFIHMETLVRNLGASGSPMITFVGNMIEKVHHGIGDSSTQAIATFAIVFIIDVVQSFCSLAIYIMLTITFR